MGIITSSRVRHDCCCWKSRSPRLQELVRRHLILKENSFLKNHRESLRRRQCNFLMIREQIPRTISMQGCKAACSKRADRLICRIIVERRTKAVGSCNLGTMIGRETSTAAEITIWAKICMITAIKVGARLNLVTYQRTSDLVNQ